MKSQKEEREREGRRLMGAFTHGSSSRAAAERVHQT
jgi:hypothetical protein